MKCKHKYIHLDTQSWWCEYGYRGRRFTMIDRFFCEHCLDTVEQKKEESFNQADKRPDWTKSITREVPAE